MNILGVQIITSLFALFMVYVAFLHWKRQEIKNEEMLFWILIWAGFLMFTLFPAVLSQLTKVLYFARIMDLLMVTAFMILAFLGFQNYVANRRMEKKIEELIRSEALKNVKNKKKLS